MLWTNCSLCVCINYFLFYKKHVYLPKTNSGFFNVNLPKIIAMCCYFVTEHVKDIVRFNIH